MAYAREGAGSHPPLTTAEKINCKKSRIFLKYGVSAVAMAAHKFFFLNQIFTVLLSLYSLLYRSMVASGGVRPRVLALGQNRSEETSQRRRAVGYTVSNFTGLGTEPQIFRIDSDICNTTL